MIRQTKTLTSQAVVSLTDKVYLNDGKRSTIHIIRYSRKAYRPRLVTFTHGTKLLTWCRENSVFEAVGGGFFLREAAQPLGELWQAGKRQPSVPFTNRLNRTRGSLLLGKTEFRIGPRNHLPQKPAGDLLQAGPILLHKGVSAYLASTDPESFSATAFQFDQDITAARHPRAAIGCNAEYIWTVTADGRSVDEAGLHLYELTEIFMQLGAQEAINLDGGRSSTQISQGRLINHPRTDETQSKTGFPIFNAIIFDEI